jgi:hypothetical protein
MTHGKGGAKTREKPPLKARMRAFLRAYAELCMVKYAAQVAGIKRREHYRWLERYPGYRKAFEETRQGAADYLESIAVERATKGWLEPVRYKGRICGYVRRFDDSLLMFLLRGMMPEKYGVQRQEVSGPQQPLTQPEVNVVFVHSRAPDRPRPLAD